MKMWLLNLFSNRPGTPARLPAVSRMACLAALGLALLAVGGLALGMLPAMARADGGPVTNLNTGLSYATIQGGIDAAETLDGHTLSVAAGIYEEQVVVTKDLTIEGAGCGATVIQSPVSLPQGFMTGIMNKPVVFVNGKSNVTLQDMTVDGAGRGNGNYAYIGIAYWNAGGKVARVCVVHVRETPLGNTEQGTGVYSYNDTGGPYALELDHVTVTDFQKAGIALSGVGMAVNVHDCTVTGSGYNDVIAQNGIQVSFGAGGAVTDCKISEIGFNPPAYTASGFLAFQCGSALTLTGLNGVNAISNVQSPVSWYDSNGSMSGIEVSGGADWGPVFIYNSNAMDKTQTPALKRPAASPLQVEPGKAFRPADKSSSYTVSVSNSCLTGTHVAGSVGIWSFTEGGGLNVSVTNSVVHDWDYGLAVFGSTATLTANFNSISGNGAAGYDNTQSLASQNAERNWWGAASGPSGVGSGSGDAVLGSGVDYDPWLHSGSNSHSGCGYAPVSYTITATAGSNGGIAPSGPVSVYEGDDQGFAITPDACYHVADVLVDGSSVGPVTSYVFPNVTADHTISASFAINTYTITASVGSHGSIAPEPSVVVNCGSDQDFIITPEPCYHVADVLVDGISVGATTDYRFINVTADHTISASFAINNYTITPSAGPHGLIAPPTPVVVVCGSDQGFTFTPDLDYHVSDILVDGISVGAAPSYTFLNVTADHTIAVVFSPNPVINLNTGLSYVTIQEGIDAAETLDGHTLQANPGIFEEQVVVTKELTIKGSGCGVTVVRSPVTLAQGFTTSHPNHPIIFINGMSHVTIQDLTIDGVGRGNLNYAFIGIAYWNGGGKISHVCIEHVRDTPFSGMQHGVGVYSYNNTGGPYALEVDHVTVTDYQKNGMALSGDGMTVNVHDCTTVGSGYTDVTAQNGIQVSYGAGGTVSNCRISEVGYTGPDWSASGLLAEQCGSPLVVTAFNCDNAITNAQVPVAWYDTNGSMNGIATSGGADWGAVFIYNSQATAKSQTAGPKHLTPAPWQEDRASRSAGKSSLFTVAVENCCLRGTHAPGTVGVYAYTEGGGLHVTATNNVVHDWDVGFATWGEAAVLTANLNSIVGNNTAGYDNTASQATQNAEYNWWGASSGPSGQGAGSGDAVVGTGVDFTPWLCSDANATSGCGFIPVTHTITATAGPNGTMNPIGAVPVYEHCDQTFTFTPQLGFYILMVTVDGVCMGPIPNYTFYDVTSPHTIVVTFSIELLTITATAGPGGTITPSGEVHVGYGGCQAFIFQADPCYHVLDCKVDGISLGPRQDYTFCGVVTNRTIDVTFAIDTFTLATSVVGAGFLSVFPAEPSYSCGDSVMIEAVPDPGWQFQHWAGDAGGSVNPLLLIMGANKSITGVFADIAPPTVTLTSPNGGEVWQSSSTFAITWTAADNAGVTAVDLVYSVDGGLTYPYTIVTGYANTGAYPWFVPRTETLTARVKVTVHDAAGNSAVDASDNNFQIIDPASSVAETMLPAGQLSRIYPNPSALGAAHVLYRVAEAGTVDVRIFDVTGHMVRTLASGSFPGGFRDLRWDGRDGNGNQVSAGIYLVRVSTNSGKQATERLVIVR